jgi:uncharacterized protein (DUF736 family)
MSRTIGIFEKRDDGYIGAINTLNHRFGGVRFVPVEVKHSDESPDYLVQIDGVELGAGWKATSQAGNAFVRVQLDDPSFPTALNANLVEGRDGRYTLLWSRRT